MIKTAIVSVTIIIYIPSTQACRKKSSDKLSENVTPFVELTNVKRTKMNICTYTSVISVIDRQKVIGVFSTSMMTKI